MAPSMLQLAGSIRGLFTVHDWQNYGHYYANTLSAWQENFERNWETIKSDISDLSRIRKQAVG
jgi:cyclopropane-fatty-acyl-phospholipid synthase